VKRLLFPLLVLAIGAAAGAAWYYHNRSVDAQVAEDAPPDDAWLDHLYSQNTQDSAEAVRHVEMLGPQAVPIITAVLQDPASEREHRKAALKACGILGPVAAPAIPDVAVALAQPDLTAEAAMALSFMGREAFAPLREALGSDDPVVRREALRSIGKLKERAPLDGKGVVPLLLDGMRDPDDGVRAVAATYLGIIHEGAEEAVPALIEGLKDPSVEVRRSAAEALGSFGPAAKAALPALRRAMGDKDPDVAREAGLAVVKLQAARERVRSRQPLDPAARTAAARRPATAA
jgi:HEAT repeat protein